MNIETLVREYPNDMELGAKVRELYFKNKKMIEDIFEKQDGKFIYESPDGGKTITKRPFGAPLSERVVIDESQLSIFPKEVEYTDEYFKPNYNTNESN